MTKAVTVKHLDRVRRTNGATGTVISAHEKGQISVLPDVGPRQCATWEADDYTRTGGPARACKRCPSKDHTVIDCPTKGTP